MTRPMSEERESLLANLRTDGEWLRRAKHATTEVIDAGNTMLKAAAEIERLSASERGMREALEPFAKIALLRDTHQTAPDMIDAPDLAITPDDVRKARAALSDEQARGQGRSASISTDN